MKEYLNEPMSRHTTFRIGGPAARYLVPETAQEVRDAVRSCREQGVPYFILGNGSNLLVSDAGYDGCVIEIGRAIGTIKAEGNRIFADAGAALSAVSLAARDEGLTGLEWACGIPGNIGGAVVMNAGAYGGEIRNCLESVLVMDPAGSMFRQTPEELELDYRYSNIPARELIVLSAVFRLEPGDRELISARIAELNAGRAEKQPLNYPSAGSAFKRPQGGFAAKLIQDAGLKGFRIGGAQVSEKHSGFIVNTGGATAADVTALLQYVSDKVWEMSGIRLEPEIRILGEI